ncbi:hypothetical protein A33M_0294 [Rhodovulum sp. PH10]|nr:hypothetical protein A33M_0294 [Rhodovulum sp. PH10]
MQRGERPVAVRPRHIGYPLAFRGQVHGTQSSLPCFPSMALFHGAALPSRGSRRARFPTFVGTTTTLRLPARAIPGRLCVRSQGPHAPPCLRVRRSAPGAAEDCSRAWDSWSAGVPVPACLHGDTCGISQVPWRSILHLCPVPRPRSNRHGLATIGLADAAPGPNTPKASTSS